MSLNRQLLVGIVGLLFSGLVVPASVSDDSAPLAGVVAQTTQFKRLALGAGQLPAAPAGKLLTLVVDGIERPLAAGTYTGNVALVVTDDIPVKYHDLPEHHFRAALYVENGIPVPTRSVSAALTGARFTEGSVVDARISSEGERFNGILVTGSGRYVIERPIIHLRGNGGNDFAGFGAALMSSGNAEVIINRPIIRTQGAIRTALFVGGHSTMHVNDAEIEVRNGTLPADYKFTVDVGRMMEVPWMLGLSGNVRASNLLDQGTLYINRSHIRAQGWGALSTDDNTHVRMYVKDSLIETMDSGYGAYSIGDSHDHFSHSVLRVADIGVIMAAEGSATLTDGTLVDSRRYGVMMHSGQGGGTLTIDKGSELRARQTAIQVKGIGTTIIVDNAQVTAGNGILLQAMENDDPFLKAMMSGQMPEGAAPPPGMAPDGGAPRRSGPPPSPDVVGTFRNTDLVGDFFNGRTQQGAMSLRFEQASVTGVLSTSTVKPASGLEPTRATYQEIGNVANTPAPTSTKNGLAVSLDAKSHWTVTGTSYLSRLELATGSRIDAGEKSLALFVNGKAVKLKPGTYTGNITLRVQ